MKLNKLIFPAPRPSYNANQLLGDIIYLPRGQLLKDMNHQDDRNKVNTNFSSLIGSKNSFTSSSSQVASNGARSNHIPCLFLPY